MLRAREHRFPTQSLWSKPNYPHYAGHTRLHRDRSLDPSFHHCRNRPEPAYLHWYPTALTRVRRWNYLIDTRHRSGAERLRCPTRCRHRNRLEPEYRSLFRSVCYGVGRPGSGGKTSKQLRSERRPNPICRLRQNRPAVVRRQLLRIVRLHSVRCCS